MSTPSATHPASATEAGQDGQPTPQLTSFGFLSEDGDQQESMFDLGSIFSRVRSAFVTQDTFAEHPAPVAEQGVTIPTSSSADVASKDASSAALSRQVASTAAASQTASFDHQRKNSKTSPSVTNGKMAFPESGRSSPLDSMSIARIATGTIQKDAQPNEGPYRQPKAPFSLSSSRQAAPAVTSTTAAHADSRHRLQSLTTSDSRSVAADDGEGEDEEDVLSGLMRRSGVDHTRPSAGTYSSIPGFPLHKETLADDTRSIHSTSSRLPRSEINSTSEAQYIVAHSHAHQRHHSRAGLGTSAEAFRRMRGEGAVLSKAFWMPDENVKECRECQSYFTPFRRKHHCRICGLVYCSRCASNLIPGSRFGLEGSEVRVCNFCLRMLSEYERAGLQSSAGAASLASSPKRMSTSYARKRTESTGFGTRPDKEMISSPLEAQLTHPQAQFAANQLFAYPRSGLAKSSFAIPPDLKETDNLQDMLQELDDASRPQTPIADMLGKVDVGGREEDHADEPVPFRVKLSEEDGIPMGDDEVPPFPPSDKGHGDGADDVSRPSSSVQGGQDLIKFPKAAHEDSSSSIRSSRGREAKTKLAVEPMTSDGRQRLVSDAALRAYRKSRLRAREGSSTEEEAKPTIRGLASSGSLFQRHNAKPDSFSGSLLSPSEGLSDVSLSHLLALLSQTLKAADVPCPQQWQRALEPLILSVIRNIHPNPKVGESMNIRQYIKFKRIPGGSISDSSYVDGFVLSKQVATKRMSRILPLSNPRVMVVSFPIDFHRAEGQFMSLEPLMAQEHEYTRILVARILQLRPNIIVVKDTVSRLALDMLEDAGVVVVWSLKMSALQAISRCCQADIISSIDRLALEPRLGRCASFGVETFQHAQFANCRKSMMRFLTSGGARSLGCTIILRGTNLETLGQVKQISSLLAFVAHNLRLEEQLNQSEGAQVKATEAPSLVSQKDSEVKEDNEGKESEEGKEGFDELNDQIIQALRPFKERVLSASASITIPPPHPLVKMKESHDKVRALQEECSSEQVKGEAVEEKVDADLGAGQQEGDEGEEGQKGEEARERETPGAEKAAEVVPSLEEVMPKPSELQAAYARALLEHDLYLKEWRSSINIDVNSGVERMSVLWALMSSATQKPCLGPQLLSFHFYGHNDETLGHFLERACQESSTICTAKGCGRPRGVHYSSFVHNETRVQVVQERFVCPIPGQENRLLMWSYCKRCEQATPVTPVSDDTWSFSFAKYLELHFYNVNKVTTLCGHDYYADFVRFFSLQNLAIRFHRDCELTVREVILPPLTLLPRPDVDYRLKVEGAKALQARMDAYWASVLERLAALRKEPHLSVQHLSQLETTVQTAKGDEADLRAGLVETCRESDQTDLLALNVVRNRLQAAVVRWDQFFQEFEKSALPNERDVRRLTSHHLSRLFQEKGSEVGQGGDRVVDALGLTPAAEVDEGVASGLDTALSTCNSDETSPATAKTQTEVEDATSSTSNDVLSPTPATWRHQRSNTLRGETLDALQGIDSGTEAKAASRPVLRRGKTSEAVPGRTQQGVDGAVGEQRVQRPQQPSSGPAGPGGRRNAAVPRRGPPSSYRPPKSILAASSGVETESDGGAASSGSAANLASRRKLSVGQRRGRAMAAAAGGGSEGEEGRSSQQAQGQSRPPSRVPVPIRSSKVSTIARRFDNLQREAERERERQRQMMAIRARRARPVAASQATVQVYRNVKEAVRDDDESDVPTSGDEGVEAEDEGEDESDGAREVAARLKSIRAAASKEGREGEAGSSRAHNPALASLSHDLASESESSPERERGVSTRAAANPGHLDGTHEAAAAELTVSSLLSGTLPASWRASLLPDGDGQESRGSLLKTITSLWARGNAHLPLIELPMRSSEHLFTDSPLVVLREDEPSSLIAFTLHSSTYASRLHSLREASQGKAGGDASLDGCSKEFNSRARLESDLRQPEGTHLSFQFTSADSRFSIRVLFTEQFDALRQACYCGQTFVQSLSRCSNWVDCSGGKSGAAMMKTLDDRFVIKQLSRAEMDAFASNAGSYFRFLADVFSQDRPTTLAKIYGVYRLTIRNAQSGKFIKLDCAITENVFANAGKMAQIYDLKGALRNRFVQPNGQASQVLQDGNLVTSKVPIFLREASKRRLRQALFHDSLFLASCEVMDYSLVVGVSEEAAEIRVGIIDFIRTFTRGKKLESLFKEAVGGGLEAPTIVDPKQYRARFLSFLDSILLLSPDHWLSKEEESRSASVSMPT